MYMGLVFNELMKVFVRCKIIPFFNQPLETEINCSAAGVDLEWYNFSWTHLFEYLGHSFRDVMYCYNAKYKQVFQITLSCKQEIAR